MEGLMMIKAGGWSSGEKSSIKYVCNGHVFLDSDVASFEPTEYGLEAFHRVVVVSENNSFVLTLTFSRYDKDVDIITDNLPCLTVIVVQGKG